MQTLALCLHPPLSANCNNIERLTIAALAHLPTAVHFVHDLTGECGTSLQHQVTPRYKHTLRLI